MPTVPTGIAASIEIFTHDGISHYLLITGELFGPFPNQDAAIDAIPRALRSMD